MIRLNLGCNDFKLNGFINIDKDPVVKPDLVVDASKLPYEDNSVDEIYAGHLLEHFSYDEDVILEWKRVLKYGGVITITVPDVEKSLKLFNEDKLSLEWMNNVILGATNRELQNHHQVFNKKILLDLMNKNFKEVFVLEDSPYLLAKVNWQTIITGKNENNSNSKI